MEKKNDVMAQETLDVKINEAACKAEQIAALIQCITEKVEKTQDVDFKLAVTGALQGVISLSKYLQHDLNDLAMQVLKSMSAQKGNV